MIKVGIQIAEENKKHINRVQSESHGIMQSQKKVQMAPDKILLFPFWCIFHFLYRKTSSRGAYGHDQVFFKHISTWFHKIR